MTSQKKNGTRLSGWRVIRWRWRESNPRPKDSILGNLRA